MNALIWVTFVRGCMSIVLGLALFVEAERGQSGLLNFMALYWLTTSIITIRWSLSGVRVRRFSLATGIVGVVAGGIALGRALLGDYIGHDSMLSVLGAVIGVTGIFHVVNGFMERHRAKLAWPAIALGVFEVILGLLLVIAPYVRSTALTVAAGAWAMLGGTLLLLDAFRMRPHARQAEPRP